MDLAEKVLDVVAAVDIVFWPVALDFKRRDVEEMADGAVAAAFVNGAIRTSEQEEMARVLRRKSRLLFAFGSCAHLGGIPGLANLSSRETILECVYGEGARPLAEWRDNGRTVTLPEFYDEVMALNQVVDVDYYIPGCPPTPKIVAQALEALLSGNMPEKGAVLAPDRALCEECPRRDTRPEKLALAAFKRPHEVLADPEQCLLAQGLVCMGPATRGGCEALCVQGNMPCSGCFGPTSRVRDYGGKALSALASMVDSNDAARIEYILGSLPDPTGTLYRYSLPSSLLRRKRAEVSHA